jgi:hypothetical protein
MGMADETDLGIYSEEPFLDWLQRGLGQLLWLILVNKIAEFFWDTVWVVVLSIIISRAARAQVGKIGFGFSLVAILVIVCLVWGACLAKTLLPAISRLAYGRPIFGELGGMARRVFFVWVRCADAVTLAFRPDDLKKIREFGSLDRDVYEWTLKNSFYRLQKGKGEKQTEELDHKWGEVWRGILAIQIRLGRNRWVGLDEAFADDNCGVRIEPIKLAGVSAIVGPIVKLVQLTMIYLFARFVDGKVQLLTVAQSSLFLCLIVCLILFLYHAHQNSTITLFGNLLSLDLPEELKLRAKAFEGLKIRPTKVTVTKRYLTLIQNYFGEWIALITLLNTISSLLIVGVVLLVTRFWYFGAFKAVLPWYREFSICLLFIPPVLLATYFVMFAVLRNLKLVLAPLVLGLLTVLIPYGFTYLIGGSVDFGQVKNSVLAIFTGLGATLATLVASRMKKIMEADGDSDKPGKDKQPAAVTG